MALLTVWRTRGSIHAASPMRTALGPKERLIVQDPLTAGVVVTLALFVLIGFVVWVLRSTPRLPAVITAIAVLLGALPAVISALFWFS